MSNKLISIISISTLIFVIFISGCSEEKVINYGKQQVVSYDELVKCDSDDDCVVVEGRGCCGCDAVINKEHKDYWYNRDVEGCLPAGRTCEMCAPEFIGAKCEENICKPVYEVLS